MRAGSACGGAGGCNGARGREADDAGVLRLRRGRRVQRCAGSGGRRCGRAPLAAGQAGATVRGVGRPTMRAGSAAGSAHRSRGGDAVRCLTAAPSHTAPTRHPQGLPCSEHRPPPRPPPPALRTHHPPPRSAISNAPMRSSWRSGESSSATGLRRDGGSAEGRTSRIRISKPRAGGRGRRRQRAAAAALRAGLPLPAQQPLPARLPLPPSCTPAHRSPLQHRLDDVVQAAAPARHAAHQVCRQPLVAAGTPGRGGRA